MVNLHNLQLRPRDIRRLVEPHLHEVIWDRGVDVTSEWVMASFEDQAHAQILKTWLNGKNVAGLFSIIYTEKSWLDPQILTWKVLLKNLEHYFNQKHVLVVAADRTWIIEYAPQQIIRFGRWPKAT